MSDVPVLILAGGRGERLAGMTDLPKPLLDIQGRPFLGYLLDLLSAAGMRRVFFLTGYRGDLFPGRLAAELRDHPQLETSFLREEEPLGTGGALARALPFVDTRALVMNGDSYCAIDCAAFLRFHAREPERLALTAVEIESAADFGSLDLDGEELRGFREKAAANRGWINAGVYVLPRAALASIPAGGSSLERDLLPRWIAERPGRAYRTRAYFCDIGTPERYALARRELPERAKRGESG
ncbi:MAG: NTP transferase domain-containing protein [Candidatus Eisenbacteria bacterium]|nr:NTP transferase domain-containing protein [Candidatus Eisenbacteria bacterium]